MSPCFSQRLGFESFTAEVESVLKDHKQQQKVCVATTILDTLFSCNQLGSREEGLEARVVWPDGGGAPEATGRAVRRQPREVPVRTAMRYCTIV